MSLGRDETAQAVWRMPTNKMTTYQSLRQKIRSCTSHSELRALEPVIERHYNNNSITMKQFALLDVLIMERIAKIEK